MSTPKQPKRFHAQRESKNHPPGNYTMGIKNEKFAERFGYLTAYWNHVEEAMIEIMNDLLGGQPRVPARQIFRGIVGNQSRIKVMKTILQESPSNAQKDGFYDAVLKEFQTLNQRRNDYVHGLWFTHDPTGRMFLSESASDDLHFSEQREVILEELENFGSKMGALVQAIIDHGFARRMNIRASRETRPPTPPDKDI